MIKKLISLFIVILIVSCKSINVKNYGIEFKDIDNMDYINTTYSSKGDKILESKTELNFMEFYNYSLDSIFITDSEKFKIGNKVLLEKKSNQELIKNLILTSNDNFNNFQIEKFINETPIFKKNNTKFLLVTNVEPSLKLIQSYTGINSFLITEPYYITNSFKLKIFIIDVTTNRIVLYGSDKTRIDKRLSYGKNIVRSFNNIFEEFNN